MVFFTVALLHTQTQLAKNDCPELTERETFSFLGLPSIPISKLRIVLSCAPRNRIASKTVETFRNAFQKGYEYACQQDFDRVEDVGLAPRLTMSWAVQILIVSQSDESTFQAAKTCVMNQE